MLLLFSVWRLQALWILSEITVLDILWVINLNLWCSSYYNEYSSEKFFLYSHCVYLNGAEICMCYVVCVQQAFIDCYHYQWFYLKSHEWMLYERNSLPTYKYISMFVMRIMDETKPMSSNNRSSNSNINNLLENFQLENSWHFWYDHTSLQNTDKMVLKRCTLDLPQVIVRPKIQSKRLNSSRTRMPIHGNSNSNSNGNGNGNGNSQHIYITISAKHHQHIFQISYSSEQTQTALRSVLNIHHRYEDYL